MIKKAKNPHMKGFEELYETYQSTDEEYISTAKLEKEKNRSLDQYELQKYLEEENERLASIESFLTKKIPAKMNFSQSAKLIYQQEDRKHVILEKTLPVLVKLTSQFQQNMSELFNTHFS